MLCVGLDPDLDRLPRCCTSGLSVAEAVMQFNEAIIDATAEFACAFKLNFAFYEAMGASCYEVLRHTFDRIPPGKITIADAKRGDIGNSARKYAEAVFDVFKADACTVAPYMGRDAVAPFLSYEDKAAFVLVRTSNESGKEFQTVFCGEDALYHHVARRVAQWHDDSLGTAGLVAGATTPWAFQELRRICPSSPFLIPGIGAQGGSVAAIKEASTGKIIVNSSRAILYASSEEDFAQAAAKVAQETRDQLQAAVAPS